MNEKKSMIAGLHGQKTLTKFLIENFDRVNEALHIT
jgi:hypothetical protein